MTVWLRGFFMGYLFSNCCRLVFRFFLTVFILSAVSVYAEPRHVVVDAEEMEPDKSSTYPTALLKMILNVSKAPDEIIDINVSVHPFSRARLIAEVQRLNTGNHVMWMDTNKEKEQLLRPIRVPMFKGLLGTRVLVIRKEDKEKFAKVKNKKDLLALKAGQGKYWIDTEILKSNNVPVTEGEDTPTLYEMIKGKRFDYFPRGIFELTYEGMKIKKHDLIVDETLLLSYPMPIYFFVNKDNAELAARLEKGWSIILKNGEFNKLFFNYPPVMAAILELKKHKRHVIRLDNPFLPAETPLDHPEYWFDVSPYEE